MAPYSTWRLLVGAACAAALGLVGGCVTTAPSNPPAAGQAGAGLPQTVKDKGGLVIGSELTTPPLTYLDTDGKTVKGLNHDLAQALGAKLGIKVTFAQYAFAGLIPAVQSGKVDLAMDIINDTRERQGLVDFVDYLRNGTTILLKKGNPEGIRVLTDLCGRSVAAVRGSVQIGLVEKASATCTAQGRPGITINQYANPPEARLQVQTGKNTAFLGNTPVMLYLAKNADGGATFEAATAERYMEQPVGLIFAKGNAQLRDAVLGALAQLWADGTYARLLDQYGLRDLALERPTVNGAAG